MALTAHPLLQTRQRPPALVGSVDDEPGGGNCIWTQKARGGGTLWQLSKRRVTLWQLSKKRGDALAVIQEEGGRSAVIQEEEHSCELMMETDVYCWGTRGSLDIHCTHPMR